MPVPLHCVVSFVLEDLMWMGRYYKIVQKCLTIIIKWYGKNVLHCVGVIIQAA